MYQSHINLYEPLSTYINLISTCIDLVLTSINLISTCINLKKPNSGVICYDESWCVLLGCTLEHTGEGGAAVRFSEHAGGLLESCLIQHNHIAVAVNDAVRCAVYSSLFQHNQQGAFYALEDILADAQVEIVDNTICRNSVLDFDRFGVWCGPRRPPGLTQRGNRENW